MVFTLLTILLFCSSRTYSAYIEENEYKGISISFSHKVKQENIDFKKLKIVLQKASEYLYHATRKQSYFGEFILSHPSSWTLDGEICETAIEAPNGIDIYITNSVQAPGLKAQHSQGCGRKGDLIYISPNWLHGHTEELARQFVQQWAIFRYGVFEEKPDVPDSCFFYGKSWFPSGCYNVPLDLEPALNKTGLPVCNLPSDFFENEDLKSSIMFTANSSKVLNFCDDSPAFPHNAVVSTPHNRLCQGKTSWSVIKNSEDFKYGRNSAREESEVPKKTSFRCLQEQPIHLTLAIQTGSVKDIDQDLIEIRYILQQFLLNVAPSDSKVNLVTFWNTASPSLVTLNLRDSSQLSLTLENHVRKYSTSSNICLSCGLQAAFKESLVAKHPLAVVMLIAWKSVLAAEKQSDMIEIIQNKKIPLYLILIDDIDSDVVSPGLIAAVRSTGGQILMLTKELVFRPSHLFVILANIFTNPLNVEEETIIIHEATYLDVRSDFTDVFNLPANASGKLMYMMHCSKKDDIGSDDSNCGSNWGPNSNTCSRAEVLYINDENTSKKVWTYKYKGRTDPLKCSSLAILKLSSALNSFTLRGWLSNTQIIPGYNNLIIYAEVNSFSEHNIEVAATVSGPGLNGTEKIELRDNGNGDPDVEKGDGIYSRYFTAFRQKGTYAVTISVKLKEKLNDEIANTASNGEAFVQTKAIGSFSVLETMPKVDILPPNRIADLKVISIDHQNKTIILSWTAPGDDYDSGTVEECKVYITEDWKDLQEEMLERIHVNTLNADGSFIPNPAGNVEEQQFLMPNGSLQSTYYMAISCADQSKNEGSISNIIQVLTNIQNDLNINMTGKNDSENSTETSTSSNIISDYNKNKHLHFYALISGIIGTIIVLIILINIIIWIACFRKYKKMQDPSVANGNAQNAAKVLKTNSKETTFKNEYDESQEYVNKIMDEYSVPQKSQRHQEKIDSIQQPVTYAKVYKEQMNRDQTILTNQSERSKVLHQKVKHGERDLGYV